MSWSGPLAGAAPFQAPPYANGQFGYGQPQTYQYGQQQPYSQYQQGPHFLGPSQRPQDSRPPKKKGNPIITRYPPPPGYRGPAQPQGPFNAQQHHAQYQGPTQPGFPQVQPRYPGQGYAAASAQHGYPHQVHGHPPSTTYPPVHPPPQNYPWPQQAHQPNQGLHQAPVYSTGQAHAPQSLHQPLATHKAAAIDHTQQAYSQAPGWSQSQAQSVYPSQTQHSGYGGPAPSDRSLADTNAIPTPTTTSLTSALPTSAPSTQSTSHEGTARKPELYLAWDDWDFDFDGAIWPKSNEPVDPNLSLGVIIWHPAKQATRALPATFEEAEEQSLRPTPEELGNGDSVSVYFTAENSHEAFLDVRQTDTWEFIIDDPIFVVFTDEEMQNNLVSYEECISQRDRPDEPLVSEPDSNDAEMHEADWSVMDNLEQALSASGRSEPAKARTQEDILASLGVTGLPKPVSQETVHLPPSAQEAGTAESLIEEPNMPSRTTYVPAIYSPLCELTVSSTMPQSQPQRTQSLSNARVTAPHSAPQRPYGSISTSSLGVPPPPPPQEQDRYDPWNPSHRRQQYHSNGFNGGRGSPARSEASNGTAAGSDFGIEQTAHAKDISLTPGSKFERSDSSVSRKRTHGDTDADDHGLREHDDHTKRKRRSLVDAAYG